MKTLFEKMRDNRPVLLGAQQAAERHRKHKELDAQRKRDAEDRAKWQAEREEKRRRQREYEQQRGMMNDPMRLGPANQAAQPTFRPEPLPPAPPRRVRAWFGWP